MACCAGVGDTSLFTVVGMSNNQGKLTLMRTSAPLISIVLHALIRDSFTSMSNFKTNSYYVETIFSYLYAQ
jgi:hypothetical protein